MISTWKSGYLSRCSSCLPPFNTLLLYTHSWWACVKVWTLLCSGTNTAPQDCYSSVSWCWTDGQEGGLSPRHLSGLMFPALPHSYCMDAREAREPATTIGKGKGKAEEDSSEPITPWIVVLLLLSHQKCSCPCGGQEVQLCVAAVNQGKKGAKNKEAEAVGTKYMTP